MESGTMRAPSMGSSRRGAVRLEPLYVVRFSYSGGWGADLAGPESAEGRFFFLAEGRISGQFRGANHPNRRSDGTFLPDFQGVIETDDGRRSSSTTEATAGPTRSVGGR
jgi:hypothetical protein